MESSPLPGSRYWQVLFLFTALMLILNLAVAIYNIARVTQSYQAMQNELKIMLTLGATHSSIQDMEISERDYLLWNDEKSVQIYRESIALVARQMQTLYAMQPYMQAVSQFHEFERLILRKLRIDSMSDLEFPYAGVPTPSGNWNISNNAAQLQEIRAAVLAIEATHEEVLATRKTAIASSKRNIAIAFGLVTAIGALGLALMYHLLRRSLAQQQRWELELRLQTNVLEERVSSRTAELQSKSLELERSNRELENFAFIASHDLQEPLRKIQAFGDRLRTRCADVLGENVDYLERMQSSAQRMSELIQDLLDFSRVTAKPRAFKVIALDQTLKDVLDDLEQAIRTSGANITASPLPELEADATQMHQLLQNLIANAIKFVDEGITPEITINAERTVTSSPANLSSAKEQAIIHVIDNGIGFEEEYAERIFQPFQRLHSRSSYSGTGIGLALCQRIVERHNGSLSASSEPGQGSDFTIILPLKQPTSDPAIVDESATPTQELQRHE